MTFHKKKTPGHTTAKSAVARPSATVSDFINKPPTGGRLFNKTQVDGATELAKKAVIELGVWFLSETDLVGGRRHFSIRNWVVGLGLEFLGKSSFVLGHYLGKR